MAKRKNTYFKKKFYNLSRKEITFLLEKDVGSSEQFNQHVSEVSYKTKIDEEIVKSILISYFTNILIIINTVQKIKTKINIYGYFFLMIRTGTKI